MTSQLLTVLAAAGLLTSGMGATSETRSAQSLPVQNLAAAHAATTVMAGDCRTVAHAKASKASCVNRLADADTDSDSGHRHRRRGGWWDSSAALGIGAAIGVGIIVAVATSNNHSNGNQGGSVSH
jgi:hypothetical protein